MEPALWGILKVCLLGCIAYTQCRLDWNSRGSKETCISWGVHVSHGKGQFFVGDSCLGSNPGECKGRSISKVGVPRRRCCPLPDYFVHLLFRSATLQGTVRVPWLAIAKSAPMYALSVAHFTCNLGYYTLLTCLPQYFKHILHFDIKSVSLSSINFLLLMPVYSLAL